MKEMSPEEKYRFNKEVERFERATGEKIPEGCCVCLCTDGHISVVPEKGNDEFNEYLERIEPGMNKLGYNRMHASLAAATCSGKYVKR